MAKKTHNSSSPRRKERRAQLWRAGQARKAERREAGAAAASANRDLRRAGLSTPTDKWADLKTRQAGKRELVRLERAQSTWRRNLGGQVRVDNRPPALRQAWRDFTADRQDAFLP